MNANFGPKDEQEELEFAVEELLADVQLSIQEAMLAQGINQAKLAELLGCDQKDVTDFLSEGANPTLHTIAHIFHVLGVQGPPLRRKTLLKATL